MSLAQPAAAGENAVSFVTRKAPCSTERATVRVSDRFETPDMMPHLAPGLICLLSVFVRLPPSRIGKYTSHVLSIPSIWFASGIAVSEAAPPK